MSVLGKNTSMSPTTPNILNRGSWNIGIFYVENSTQYCTYKIQQFQVQYQQLVHRKVCKQLSLNIRHTRTPEPEFKHTNKSRRIRILEVSNFYIPFPIPHSPLTYSLPLPLPLPPITLSIYDTILSTSIVRSVRI